jgi:hypothetical protein
VLYFAAASLMALQGSIAQSTTSHTLPSWVTNLPEHEAPSTVSDYIILESPVCGMPCLGCVEITMTIPNPGVITVPVSCLFGTTTITQTWPPPRLSSSTLAAPFAPRNETRPIMRVAATAAPAVPGNEKNKLYAVDTSDPVEWHGSLDYSNVVTTTIHSTVTEDNIAKVSVYTTTVAVHTWSGSLTTNTTATTTSTITTATAGAGMPCAFMNVTALVVGFFVMLLLFL